MKYLVFDTHIKHGVGKESIVYAPGEIIDLDLSEEEAKAKYQVEKFEELKEFVEELESDEVLEVGDASRDEPAGQVKAASKKAKAKKAK